jgi:hypothetical protein
LTSAAIQRRHRLALQDRYADLSRRPPDRRSGMERTVSFNPSVSASLAGITLAQCSVCTGVSSTTSEFDASVGVASAHS